MLNELTIPDPTIDVELNRLGVCTMYIHCTILVLKWREFVEYIIGPKLQVKNLLLGDFIADFTRISDQNLIL